MTHYRINPQWMGKNNSKRKGKSACIQVSDWGDAFSKVLLGGSGLGVSGGKIAVRCRFAWDGWRAGGM